MSDMLDFNVEEIQPVTLQASGPLAARDLMSPYVWDEGDGVLRVMVRAVPAEGQAFTDTGTIWYGESSDGQVFRMTERPVIAPSPDGLDPGGCEDPTVMKVADGYVVYYTGVDATRSSGQMLYAAGPSVDRLEKKGVALASSKTEGNTKEATVQQTADGRWRLFYEFARDEASLIGLALGDGIAGPWHEQPQPFGPRVDSWDPWHLSTGPMLMDEPDRPVMFYNGATRDARWRIGWVAFDRDCTKVVDRDIQPLITPPPDAERTGTDIVFAASVVVVNGQIWLYYSRDDRVLFRARIRRS